MELDAGQFVCGDGGLGGEELLVHAFPHLRCSVRG